jgi:hypothetical protein
MKGLELWAFLRVHRGRSRVVGSEFCVEGMPGGVALPNHIEC